MTWCTYDDASTITTIFSYLSHLRTGIGIGLELVCVKGIGSPFVTLSFTAAAPALQLSQAIAHFRTIAACAPRVVLFLRALWLDSGRSNSSDFGRCTSPPLLDLSHSCSRLSGLCPTGLTFGRGPNYSICQCVAHLKRDRQECKAGRAELGAERKIRRPRRTRTKNYHACPSYPKTLSPGSRLPSSIVSRPRLLIWKSIPCFERILKFH